MRSIKKIIAAALAAAALIGTVNAYAAVSVQMNNVTTAGSISVSFEGDTNPIIVNDVTLVPARVFAQSTGMEILWDAQAQTALISVGVDYGTPLAEFAFEQLNKTAGYGGLDLTPKCITAALTLGHSNAMVRYVFVDGEGDEVCLGKTEQLEQAPVLSEDDSLMIPLRETAMMFGMQVAWDESSKSVQITVPNTVVAPKGLKIVPSYVFGEVTAEEEPAVYTETVEEDAPVPENNGTYLGRFKITHYCPCSICNGGWSGTAWAGGVTPGQTIAVDPNVIPKLSWVYIDGYGLRRAEDCGGGIKGNHIDLAVSSHSEAYRLGVVYKDVWLQ